MQDSDTTKYVIQATISTDGLIERPDVVGAIFGQTEGLLGSDLDLRDLQKTGRIGRIDVDISSKGGKSSGTITIPSSLDRVETAILAASLETIDRVGPCTAHILLENMIDVRAAKRRHIIDRAKYVLTEMFSQTESQEIAEEVKKSVRIEEITSYGQDNLPAGPHVTESDTIILVEGRADVLTLLRYGIKNAVAVGGTSIPDSIIPLCKEKTVTAFTDGDRGGELIVKELLQMADIDFVARAPDGKGVEELVQKEIVTALRQKEPVDQAVISYAQEAEPKRKIHDRGTKIRKKAVAKPPKVQKPENGSEFATHVKELSDTLGARLLDSDTNVIKEVPVRDLADSLKGCTDNIESVVFDGVITQRILDIAAEKGVKHLVGAEMGRITKHPTSVHIMATSST